MPNAIEAFELKKNFGAIEAVRGVSFDVKEGEIFGFLGPNGAGKSTTISMLITLLKPSSGRALVAGYDIVTQRDQVRGSIGVIFQEQALDAKVTAMDNLNLHAILYGVPGPIARERIEAGLKAVDLWDRRNDPVERFSGGMKRRLEMARGLIHQPKILFLDEPTIGLDPQARLAMWDHIKKLHQQFGITIFLTTHYMDEAETCDRIAIIDHGKIIAADTPQGLKDSLGGDLITLTTDDNELAKKIIFEHFNIEGKINDKEIRLQVKDAEKILAQIIRDLPLNITKVSLSRPTLDDVFIAMTGRALREEGADKKNLFMRMGMRSR